MALSLSRRTSVDSGRLSVREVSFLCRQSTVAKYPLKWMEVPTPERQLDSDEGPSSSYVSTLSTGLLWRPVLGLTLAEHRPTHIHANQPTHLLHLIIDSLFLRLFILTTVITTISSLVVIVSQISIAILIIMIIETVIAIIIVIIIAIIIVMIIAIVIVMITAIFIAIVIVVLFVILIVVIVIAIK